MQDGKKILLKKRSAATGITSSDPGTKESLDSPPTNSEINHVASSATQGEIFNQFYRPLRLDGGEERLCELAKAPLAPIEVGRRLSRQEREVQAGQRQSVAESLARHIFELVQIEREANLDRYLGVYDQALSGLELHETYDILQRTNHFFSEHYNAPIRERGERPEVLAQVLRRIGQQHAPRIKMIVNGLDVEATVQVLWQLYHGGLPDRADKIRSILLDLTERQIIALRNEFVLFPYKDVARQIYSALNPNTNGSSPSAALIGNRLGKGERRRDQLRTLIYLLRGRGEDETRLIRRWYLELGDQGLPDDQLTLESHIQREFSPEQIQLLQPILRGWSANEEARQWHAILDGVTIRGIPEDRGSDPLDTFVSESTLGYAPLVGKFKRHRLVLFSRSVQGRVALSFEELRERIAALDYRKFADTNVALSANSEFQLDSKEFYSLQGFDARHRAVSLRERIRLSSDVFESLQPLEFLDPRACLEVQQAYHALFGVALRSDLEARYQGSEASLSVSHLTSAIDRYVDGRARLPLNSDLLAEFSADDQVAGPWEPDFVIGDSERDLVAKIAGVLEGEESERSKYSAVVAVLEGLSLNQLHGLERAFFELTEPATPLRVALEEELGGELATALMAHFSGLDVNAMLAEMQADPLAVRCLQHLNCAEVLVVRNAFERTFSVTLVDYVLQASQQLFKDDGALSIVAAVLKPEVFEARRILARMGRESIDDVERLVALFSGSDIRVMAFERAYDQNFGSLRTHLKLALARRSLAAGVFVHLVLLLEGIDPKILAQINNCIERADVQLLLEILRSHKSTQRIIEECYDLLSPERRLRSLIKELKIEQDLINEVLLHLDGYCSLDVAREVRGLVAALQGDELIAKVLDVVAPSTAESLNLRIPSDVNWTEEMIYQVGLAYSREFGESLIVSCGRRGASGEKLEALIGRLYGSDIASSAGALFELIKGAKQGREASIADTERLVDYLESRGAKYRERVLFAYHSYWAHRRGFGGLLDDLTQLSNTSAAMRKILTLFLGLHTK